LDVMTEELEKILVEPPSTEEIQKAITNLESEEYYGLETVDGLARKAGSFETLFGDPGYFQKFIKQVHALKPGDITRAARKYLLPKSLVAVYLSRQPAPASQKLLAKWQKAYTQTYAKAKRRK